jgi:hypothetical protein
VTEAHGKTIEQHWTEAIAKLTTVLLCEPGGYQPIISLNCNTTMRFTSSLVYEPVSRLSCLGVFVPKLEVLHGDPQT